MQPYGDRGYWETEDYGVPTRIGDLRSKNRKELRRLLHKQARNDAKKEIRNEQKDLD